MFSSEQIQAEPCGEQASMERDARMTNALEMRSSTSQSEQSETPSTLVRVVQWIKGSPAAVDDCSGSVRHSLPVVEVEMSPSEKNSNDEQLDIQPRVVAESPAEALEDAAVYAEAEAEAAPVATESSVVEEDAGLNDSTSIEANNDSVTNVRKQKNKNASVVNNPSPFKQCLPKRLVYPSAKNASCPNSLIPLSDTIPIPDKSKEADSNTKEYEPECFMHYYDTMGKLHLDPETFHWGTEETTLEDDTFLAYDQKLGRIYHNSFTLNGASFEVGDFVKQKSSSTGTTDFFRVVGAFQATRSFVGVWSDLDRTEKTGSKNRRKEEIQKRGHPYMFVLPVHNIARGRKSSAWKESELLLGADARFTPGHIDMLPHWLGEPGIQLEKIQVPSDLLMLNLPKTWDKEFSAQLVQFFQKTRGTIKKKERMSSAKIWYTEQSSDDSDGFDSDGDSIQMKKPRKKVARKIKKEVKKGQSKKRQETEDDEATVLEGEHLEKKSVADARVNLQDVMEIEKSNSKEQEAPPPSKKRVAISILDLQQKRKKSKGRRKQRIYLAHPVMVSPFGVKHVANILTDDVNALEVEAEPKVQEDRFANISSDDECAKAEVAKAPSFEESKVAKVTKIPNEEECQKRVNKSTDEFEFNDNGNLEGGVFVSSVKRVSLSPEAINEAEESNANRISQFRDKRRKKRRFKIPTEVLIDLNKNVEV
eukprot:scaffold158261_cov62-Attheya_sp.AAC.1